MLAHKSITLAHTSITLAHTRTRARTHTHTHTREVQPEALRARWLAHARAHTHTLTLSHTLPHSRARTLAQTHLPCTNTLKHLRTQRDACARSLARAQAAGAHDTQHTLAHSGRLTHAQSGHTDSRPLKKLMLAHMLKTAHIDRHALKRFKLIYAHIDGHAQMSPHSGATLSHTLMRILMHMRCFNVLSISKLKRLILTYTH